MPKNYPPKEFAKLKNYREVWYKILHTSYPFSYSQMWTVSLHYPHNWQNYTAFSRGKLVVEMLSKTVLTVQDSANIVRVNTFLSIEIAQTVFYHLSPTLVKLIKLRTSLLIAPAENCPISSPVFFSETIWASDKGYKIASCIARCWIFHSIWQWSVALFHELQKQKLINGFNYCLQKHYHNNYITVTSMSCKTGFNFVEINEN